MVSASPSRFLSEDGNRFAFMERAAPVNGSLIHGMRLIEPSTEAACP
jgi:hypothetical protein